LALIACLGLPCPRKARFVPALAETGVLARYSTCRGVRVLGGGDRLILAPREAVSSWFDIAPFLPLEPPVEN